MFAWVDNTQASPRAPHYSPRSDLFRDLHPTINLIKVRAGRRGVFIPHVRRYGVDISSGPSLDLEVVLSYAA